MPRKYIPRTGDRAHNLSKPIKRTSQPSRQKPVRPTFQQTPGERANPHTNRILEPFTPPKQEYSLEKMNLSPDLRQRICQAIGIDQHYLQEFNLFTSRYGGTSTPFHRFVIKVPVQPGIPRGEFDLLEVRKTPPSAGVDLTIEYLTIEQLLRAAKLLKPLPK